MSSPRRLGLLSGAALMMMLAGTVRGVEADPVLDGALAVLRINDLRWLERHLQQFVATSGSPQSLLQQTVARLLFHSRGMDGIDTSRPAVVAWREGVAPLIAVIPLSNRLEFIDSFGAVAPGFAPMVRIGERDGTMVYSQNTAAGLWEYRLMVQDDTAYLARTAHECRQLASRPLRQPGLQVAPLSLSAKGAWFRARNLIGDAGLGLPVSTVGQNLFHQLVRFGDTEWAGLLEQMARFDCDVIDGADGGVLMQTRIQAKADTVLADLIAAQKNNGSRLLPLLRSPRTFAALYGGISWQGQLDRLGQRLIEPVRKELGDRWTLEVEEAWRASWVLRDRNGLFAMAWDSVAQPGRQPQLEVRGLVEQVRATEVVTSARILEQALAVDPAQAEQGFKQRFTDMPIAGLVGYAHSMGFPNRPPGQDVQSIGQFAGARHVGYVQANRSRVDDLATALAAKLEQDAPPEGNPAVLAFQYDFVAQARAEHPEIGEQFDRVLPAVLSAHLTVTPQSDLMLQVDVPLRRIALVQRETNQYIAPLQTGDKP